MSWLKNTFEISHTNHKTITSMEGVRGLAVLLVFLVHYGTLVDPWLTQSSITQQISTQLSLMGNIGVDLFFVLSGFLIYGLLIRREQNYGKYFMRRIQRIYPTFLVVFATYVFLSYAFPAESKIPQGWEGVKLVAQNLILLPGMFEMTAIVTVAWSLSYEFFSYIFIPLLIIVFGLRQRNRSFRVILLVVLSVALFSYFLFNEQHIRLLMFFSGMLVFEAHEHFSSRKIPAVGLPALISTVALIIFLNVTGTNGLWGTAIIYILLFAFCLDCFSSTSKSSRIFSYTPLRWLGNMSYSYYLIHGLALKFLFVIIAVFFKPMGDSDWFFWAGIPLALVATLIPSAILFILIEKPFSLLKSTAASKTPINNETQINLATR